MPDRVVPLVTTDNLPALKQFYMEHFGFEVSFENEEYLGLKADETELGFMRPGSAEQPTFSAGLTLCFPVASVDEEHRRLLAAGVPFVQTPEDKPWGDRCAIALDPIGIAVYLHQPIEPQPEFREYIKE